VVELGGTETAWLPPLPLRAVTSLERALIVGGDGPHRAPATRKRGKWFSRSGRLLYRREA
jgi:hypothetical protein